ncbi:unnamed protein product [Alopecurus aequalis]
MDSTAAGSGKSAVDQEVVSPNCTDDEEIMQQVLQFQLDRFGDSFIQDEAEEKERREMVKEAQESLARRKKALLPYWQGKFPTTKDEESQQAQAPVTGPEESEQLLKDKFAILDLEGDSNRTTESNSVTIIQDDHVDSVKSALAKKTADEEAEAYDRFQERWEDNCCKDCDHFQHKTLLSSMHFTHCTPGMVPNITPRTLQIFSVKLKLTEDNAGGFELPLSVYGIVAVRDALDSRRNILFSCGRTKAQQLTQDDPFLHLTGPSRAIMSEDKVYFEINLLVKGAAGSQDKPLITCVRAYGGGGSGAALCLKNVMCTLEVCLHTVKPAVQATIVGVQIVNKKDLWPSNFTYGGLVACTPLPRRTTDSGGNQEFVLLESKDREMPQGDMGYVPLSRQVVCVEHGGGLNVDIKAYNKFGLVGAEGRVHFKAKNCHLSQQRCTVGQHQVTVAVAWSVVPTDMDDLVCF